ncbi:carboxylesterase family protein [Hyphomonas sp.]|uniref:carboxylesterase/lipase family protein n=1 Tax=Hyphomonas sp. TaxID=87 RepID=UPI000C438617|nr:carboxylesterase family protein [Hyphomonas sp.]MBM59498.1 carboxylesterase [Hyphomonas sp.]
MASQTGFRNLLLAMAATALSACGNPEPEVSARPLVELRQGVLAGEYEGRLDVFRGIPYAAPPVGGARWTAPGPAPAWEGVRDASSFGPACIQPPVPETSLYYDPPADTSEDCLTLNVWAGPDADAAPVIVWIHGGSLRIGSSAEPMYDGAEFARRGVVFVSINYRLGVLGYLAHADLSAESPDGVSGNYGLQDQIAALQWVRDNIEAFGGDPSNVTIMGESAGALSVSYLLTSPDAEGLFHKAIIESPNARNFPELKTAAYGLPSAEDIGAEVFANLGLETLEAARAMDAQELTNQAKFTPQGTVDGKVLPSQIIDAFDTGRFAKVPVLAGFNSGEVRAQRAFAPRPPDSPEAYEAEIATRYGDTAEAFLDVYPSDDVQGSILATLRDAIYGWAAERIVRKEAAAGQPAFMYVFDYCSPAAKAKDLCAFHASELPFVFGNLDSESLPPNWPVPDGDQDQAISKALLDYWTSFAATGQPESVYGPVWSSYGQDQSYLDIGQTLASRTDPIPGMFELHEQLVAERKAASEPWFLNIGLGARPLSDAAGNEAE